MMQGSIVKSMAGHDKASFYVVVECDGDFVTIADGRRRKLKKPKRKNAIHLQKTNQVVDLTQINTDKKLRRALWDLNFSGENQNKLDDE